MTPEKERPNGNYIKFGNEETDANRAHLNYNLHEWKDGFSDYDFVKIEQWNSLLKTSKKAKILTGWVVGDMLPESLQASSEADKRKFFWSLVTTF